MPRPESPEQLINKQKRAKKYQDDINRFKKHVGIFTGANLLIISESNSQIRTAILPVLERRLTDKEKAKISYYFAENPIYAKWLESYPSEPNPSSKKLAEIDQEIATEKARHQRKMQQLRVKRQDTINAESAKKEDLREKAKGLTGDKILKEIESNHELRELILPELFNYSDKEQKQSTAHYFTITGKTCFKDWISKFNTESSPDKAINNHETQHETTTSPVMDSASNPPKNPIQNAEKPLELTEGQETSKMSKLLQLGTKLIN